LQDLDVVGAGRNPDDRVVAVLGPVVDAAFFPTSGIVAAANSTPIWEITNFCSSEWHTKKWSEIKLPPAVVLFHYSNFFSSVCEKELKVFVTSKVSP